MARNARHSFNVNGPDRWHLQPLVHRLPRHWARRVNRVEFVRQTSGAAAQVFGFLEWVRCFAHAALKAYLSDEGKRLFR
jgi:hypothetical protein